MREHDFAEKLAFSRGRAADTHPDTIRALISGCVRVQEAGLDLDKQGIDFVATLRSGVTLNIDLKTRLPGCSRYWSEDPELALEYCSVKPTNGHKGKNGWTLDDSKLTDYTLHVFDPSDSAEVFLLPFQLLRLAFKCHILDWLETYKRDTQTTVNGRSSWQSQCVFVPASVVIEAIVNQMRQRPA